MKKAQYQSFLNKLVSISFTDEMAVYTEENQCSYRELRQEICNIFYFLNQRKIKDTRIGIICSNNVWTLAAICAVMKYGASFVPIIATEAQDRNQNIIDSAGLNLILSKEERPAYKQIQLIEKQEGAEKLMEQDLQQRLDQPEAYLLFTSGSSGLPKGVPVAKFALMHCIDHLNSEFGFVKSDNFLQPFQWTFDVSIFSYLCPLTTGASCYLLPNKNGMKSIQILNVIRQHEITVACLVPSMMSLVKKYLESLNDLDMRYLFFAGEAFLDELARTVHKAFPKAEISNLYGPTEGTIFISQYNWKPQSSSSEAKNGVVPIGQIFPNHHWVLLKEDRIQDGEKKEGELCIAGPQIIDQYFNKKNEEQFLDLEFNGKEKRFYRTGDWVKVNEKGNLLFLGRLDEQVQIQGHRVEIKEVEHQIQMLVGKDCAVIVNEKKAGEIFLTAFVLNCEMKVAEIKKALAVKLNSYMIPREIIFIEQFPLNKNAKIDKIELKQIWNNR